MLNRRWGALLGGVAGVLFIPQATLLPASAVEPTPSPTTPVATAPRAADGRTEYIVGFRSASTPSVRAATNAVLGTRVQRQLSVFPGMVARLTTKERDRLAADPVVAWVEPNTPVHASATQPNPPWGLDRIDQASLPLNDSYTVSRDGSGVKEYVLDTGIDATNADVGGRVDAGTSFVRDEHGTTDCNGHGTEVASTIGGTKYGVAKGVTLVPVRVLDCAGNGTSAEVVAALDWVAKDHHKGNPAVANLSLSGPFNKATNDAVQRLVDDGVTVVVAAGNDDEDACMYSPASAPRALTVGATDSADQRAYFSNKGTCVDLYAPGVDVPSAVGPGIGVATSSGTSVATPHVSGVAALILATHPSWSPAKVSDRVLQLSLSGAVGANPAGTPNRLLNIAPTVTAVDPAEGSTAGSRTLTLTGERFRGVTAVLFDGVPGSRLKVRSSTRLTVATPKHERGPVAVTVVTELSSATWERRFTYQERPVVSSVSPSAGPTGGGTTVRIQGTHFLEAVGVTFGRRAATSFKILSDTEIEAIVPRGRSGTVDVRVAVASTTSAAAKAGRFRYGSPAKVKKISATKGLTIGGTRVTLTGSSFSTANTVLFDGVPGTGLKVKSSKKLTVTVPAHDVGDADVQVVNRYGTSTAGRRAVLFSYVSAPAPVVARVAPVAGYTVGGATVTITGTNFHGVTAVAFGSKAATIVSASPTRLVVVAPAHPVGTATVQVTGAYGTSEAAAGAGYTYAETPAPTVTKVSPDSGSAAGGTHVTITGTNFRCIDSVTFDDVPGTKVEVLSTTKLRVTTPAHAAGTVTVQVVVNPYIASAPSTTARFTYT